MVKWSIIFIFCRKMSHKMLQLTEAAAYLQNITEFMLSQIEVMFNIQYSLPQWELSTLPTCLNRRQPIVFIHLSTISQVSFYIWLLRQPCDLPIKSYHYFQLIWTLKLCIYGCKQLNIFLNFIFYCDTGNVVKYMQIPWHFDISRLDLATFTFTVVSIDQ